MENSADSEDSSNNEIHQQIGQVENGNEGKSISSSNPNEAIDALANEPSFSSIENEIIFASMEKDALLNSTGISSIDQDNVQDKVASSAPSKTNDLSNSNISHSSVEENIDHQRNKENLLDSAEQNELIVDQMVKLEEKKTPSLPEKEDENLLVKETKENHTENLQEEIKEIEEFGEIDAEIDDALDEG